VDDYLRDMGQTELGIKRRGGKKGVEVKGLVGTSLNSLTAPPFTGPIEIWTKWVAESLELNLDSTIATDKQRWLRKFDTTQEIREEIPLDQQERPIDNRPLPALGCNVEFTKVTFPKGNVWWTLGFEAFGHLQTVERDLRFIAEKLAARRPPALGHALPASYPAWLNRFVLQSGV
jgi:hypothetical protein